MNTNNHTAAANNALEAEVRARVPQWMKDAVEAIAGERVGGVGADIVREAVTEYLQRRKPSHVEQTSGGVATSERQAA